MLAWVSLVHAGTFFASSIDEHLRAELGIGAAEQDSLKQIAFSGGETKLSELARRLYLSEAGMTKMVSSGTDC